MQKYTVTEITRAVKQTLENTFVDNVGVKGEISSFSRSPAGHLYFVLKDEKAQIKCVMFRGMAGKNSGYEPKNGDSVEAVGEISVYEAGGNYQLLVKKLDYDSVGLFWQLFEEVKKKLQAEGLFAEELKKQLPYLPKRAAVITSPEGAAIKDFLVTMKNSGAVFAVDVWPVPVQGKDAVAPIVNALSKAGSMTDRYDVLVLMRGGGSLEDLAVFNEEYVTRALAACDVPTVSAIGHERDFSICDFTADVRVATPTAAASLLGQGYCESGKRLDETGRKLSLLMKQKMMQSSQQLDMSIRALGAVSPLKQLERSRERLGYMLKSLGVYAGRNIASKRTAVSELESRLQKLSPALELDRKKNRVTELENRIREALIKKSRSTGSEIDVLVQKIKDLSPERKAERYRSRIDSLMFRMKTSVKIKISDNKSVITPLMAKLEALDPHNVLSKGYSFVMKDGKPLKSVFDVSLQDELEIRLNDGYINSFVTGKKASEGDNG